MEIGNEKQNNGSTASQSGQNPALAILEELKRMQSQLQTIEQQQLPQDNQMKEVISLGRRMEELYTDAEPPDHAKSDSNTATATLPSTVPKSTSSRFLSNNNPPSRQSSLPGPGDIQRWERRRMEILAYRHGG